MSVIVVSLSVAVLSAVIGLALYERRYGSTHDGEIVDIEDHYTLSCPACDEETYKYRACCMYCGERLR